MHPFLSEVEEAVSASALLPDGTACVVAVSGGPDSMVLLETLAALAPRHAWRLVVAHFNHRLRGTDSDEDQRFVEAASRRLGLQQVTGGAEVASAVGRSESLEAVARRLRHGFLARAARDHGCDRVALGHHADDQTELFLMRLLRGAGGSGLAGMASCDPSPVDAAIRLVRPLLGFRRARLERVAAESGWAARCDATNADAAFLRNRVRHELIPFLRDRYQPGVERVLEREQEILREQALAVEGWADAWLRSPGDVGFAALRVAVQREVLRLQLERMRIPPEFDLIEVLRQGEGEVIQVDADRRVVRDGTGRLGWSSGPGASLAFRFEEQIADLTGSVSGCSFGGLEIRWSIQQGAEAAAGIEAVVFGEIFDADAVGPRVRLRHWRPGDRFHPIGLGSRAKLQDLFTNARVPAAERRGRVVAEGAGGEIFWVEGLRIGEVAKVAGATRRRLRWHWARSGK